MASLKLMPSSSRTGSSSLRYSSYCNLFSTLALTPVGTVSRFSRAPDWGRYTLEYPNGGREVVDSSGGAESSGDDGRRGDEIIGKCIV